MRTLAFSLLSLLAGCTARSPEISVQLAQRFTNPNLDVIDLAELGPGSWQRACVLAPYTGNAQAELLLGFKWDAEGKTSIASNDGINVLVFVRGTKVVAYTEHPRNQGDLSEVSPRCLPRNNGKLVRRPGKDGWVYLVAQNST
jgi:hypothetical protein